MSSLPKEGDGSFNFIFQQAKWDTFNPPKDGKVLALVSNMSVAEAVRFLYDKKILCAPVYNPTSTKDSWVDKYIGICDFLGCVNWMISQYDHMPEDFEEFLLRDKFQKTPISSLVDTARWSPFIPLDPKINTVLDAMFLLGKYGVHRVVTVDSPGGDLSNIITESAVLDWLQCRLDQFGGFADQQIDFLGLATDGASPQKIISVKTSDTYWKAFQLMSDHCISGVPVVNDEGVMVGNLSVRDIRSLIAEPVKFQILNKPIGTFPEFKLDLVTCKATDTLKYVINRFHTTKVHRMYVLDPAGCPVSVISLRNVLAQFVLEPPTLPIGQYFAR